MLMLALFALVSLAGVNTDAHHAVLRFNLEEMTATADRIFVGRCAGVEQTEEMIAQGMMPVTRYTFEVERAIKGKLPATITFRQLGHPPRRAGKGEISIHGQAATTGAFLHGMSQYKPGDRCLLFLIPNYLGGKTTYPVGLYQGAFFVSEMPSGEKLARNSINNLGLFTAPYNGTKMKGSDAKIIFPEQASQNTTVESLARIRGALPLDQFLDLIEQIVIAHGGQRGTITSAQRGGIQQ
jgi:hypothetical protein